MSPFDKLRATRPSKEKPKKNPSKPATAGKKGARPRRNDSVGQATGEAGRVPVKKASPEKEAPKTSSVSTEKKEPLSASAKALDKKGPPKIRIRLSAFDHTVLDDAARKIIDTSERAGAVVHGPIPLPTRIKKFTVQRATFKFKDARDQFEMRTHRRLIDLTETTFKTMDALQNLSLPSGVDIEIKMMS